MRKTYVIGDIHGCYESLLNQLELVDCARGTLIFLGDYINRGPDSQKVVSLVIQLKKELPRVITLLGNHEAMFLRYLQGEGQQIFLRIGGQNTLKSYGIDPMRGNDHNIYIPEEHMAFFNNLLLNWEDDKYIFVHAGLQPGVHLSMQTKDWCLWARDEFISSAYNFGKRVIFGHTVFAEPLMRAEKVGIDTGAVYGNRLTCIVLPGEEFVSVPGQQNNDFSF
ncbi:MAG: metallophosphoesterase family protein [Desulfobulbaceae bacterium]